ncbi:hypothetical protein [Streptomyces sp. NBRC 110611]|uniref:hypothetical protein n=1 Tax=Streptomyces sp. NBRC 110611 TaxID=1621259 RepID=UPI0008338852|nr:hypothetical protein [Streptomyces sp. NBRC 110611]
MTVSALAASLAGCLSVSEAPRPKPSGSATQQDGKDAEPGPGVTPDGRGDGPRRTVRDAEARPAGGRKAGEPSSAATRTPSASPGTPSRSVQPSGPEPGASGGHGGSDGHDEPDGHSGSPGTPEPTPSRTHRPSTPPASPTPDAPSAEPTPPPSSPEPPPPSTHASGPSPASPMFTYGDQDDPGDEFGA